MVHALPQSVELVADKVLSPVALPVTGDDFWFLRG
jgi:hypothetical protein